MVIGHGYAKLNPPAREGVSDGCLVVRAPRDQQAGAPGVLLAGKMRGVINR
jgi:hypothetical protein